MHMVTGILQREIPHKEPVTLCVNSHTRKQLILTTYNTFLENDL